MNNKKNIAVFLSSKNEEFQYEICVNLINTATEKGYNVLFFYTTCVTSVVDEYDLGEVDIFSLANFEHLDGAIILGSALPNDDYITEIKSKAHKNNVPVVCIDNYQQDCFNIVFEDAKPIEEITSHFINVHGFNKFGYIAGMPNTKETEIRFNSFKGTLDKHGIDFDEDFFGYGCYWSGKTFEVLENFLRLNKPLPQAIVCANDSMAIAAYEFLTQKGYRVPEDIAVSGYDGIPEALCHIPSITTSSRGYNYAGIEAVNVLTELFEGQKVEKIRYIMPNTMINSSCGCFKENEILNNNRLKRELYNRNYNIISSQTNLIRMLEKMTASQTVNDLCETLKCYIEKANFSEFYLCLNENFEQGGANSYTQVGKGYCKKMKEYLSYNNDEYNEGETFSTKIMTPCLYKINEDDMDNQKGKVLYFTPLHYWNKNFGYVVMSTPYDSGEVFLYSSWLMNICNALENIRVKTELLKNMKKLEQMYITDSLTNLYNRRGFYMYANDIFDNAIKNKDEIMIFVCDLDGLKKINDIYGHDQGDNAIKVVGNAISFASQRGEICARTGGDEYIVMCDRSSKELANQYVKTFKNYLRAYNLASGRPYKVHASCGVISASPQPDETIDFYIKKADGLMYDNKSSKVSSRCRNRM